MERWVFSVIGFELRIVNFIIFLPFFKQRVPSATSMLTVLVHVVHLAFFRGQIGEKLEVKVLTSWRMPRTLRPNKFFVFLILIDLLGDEVTSIFVHTFKIEFCISLVIDIITMIHRCWYRELFGPAHEL